MNRGKKSDKFSYITEGPILKSLFTLGLPIMLSQLLQTLYNLADTLWVGRVGAGAVAAISISFPVVFLTISIAAGLTIAGTALIAQYKGAGREEEIDHVLGQMFSFIGLIAGVIAVLGFIFSRKMMLLMGAEPTIIGDATGYIRIIFAGMPFMFAFFIFSATLRGMGDTMTPAIMMLVSVVLNIVLDPLLIFGVGPFPEFGVQGAAIATIFSRGVVAIYAMIILFKGTKGLHLKLEHMVPDWEIITKIVKIGVPSSVEQSMIALGQVFMTGLVTSFGTMTLAAYGIVNRVISLPSILAFGLSASATTMVGQNIGADKNDRAKETARVSLKTIFISLTGLGVLMMIDPRWIVRIFNDAPEVLRYGSQYLRIVALSFGFIGVMIISNGVFKGAGKTVPPMIISSASQWVFRFGVGFLLARLLNWDQRGLWWAMAISNVAGALMGVIWLKLSDWSHKVIEDKKPALKLAADAE
mgnify:CR=1 FL=1